MPPETANVPIVAADPWELLYLAPEVLLSVWGLLVLVVDISAFRRASSERRRQWLGYLSLAGTLVTLLVCVVSITGVLGIDPVQADYTLFFGTLSGD